MTFSNSNSSNTTLYRTVRFMLVVIVFLVAAPIGLASQAANTAYDWRGQYTYYQLFDAEKQIFWEYEAHIKKDGQDLKAFVSVDGYMTIERLHCIVELRGDEAAFIVQSVDEAAFIVQSVDEGRAKPGELLFRLRRVDETLLTTWGVLKPDNLKIQTTGEYFSKNK